MLKNLFLVLMLLITLTSLKLVANTAQSITSLQHEVNDRDFALQITASAINTCQEWLDHSRSKVKAIQSHDAECMGYLAETQGALSECIVKLDVCR